jgi:hypothetical protein
MKHLLLSLLIAASLGASAQVYNPSLHVPINKGLGVAQAAPTDARSMFYDADNFVYRAYQNTTEVLTYLSLAKYRTGGFDIIVNSGGSLASGVITGGTNTVYWFRNGTHDSNLVVKIVASGETIDTTSLSNRIDALVTDVAALNPMTTEGDMIRGGTSGVPTRLSVGTNGQIMQMIGGVPAWGTGASWSGTFGGTATTSSTTVTLSTSNTMNVFTGSSPSTYTLPSLASSTSKTLFIKNNGTADITLQRAGSDQIWDSAAVTSVTINPGESKGITAVGGYWTTYLDGVTNATNITSGTMLDARLSGNIAKKDSSANTWFGDTYYGTDNTDDFGGIDGSANLRPRDLLVGRNLIVDNAGSVKFGDALTVPDVRIIRGAAGRIDVVNNASAFRDLKVRTVTATENVNAAALPAATRHPDSVVVLNRSTGNLEVVKFPAKMDSVATASATTADSALYFNRTSGDLEMRPIPSGGAVNANDITSGTLTDARLSANVPLLNAANLFTNNQTITKTSEQFRARYDANNYFTLAVASSAIATFDLTASSGTPNFAFGKSISITGALTASTDITATGQAGTDGRIATFNTDGKLVGRSPLWTSIALIDSANTFTQNQIFNGQILAPNLQVNAGTVDSVLWLDRSTGNVEVVELPGAPVYDATLIDGSTNPPEGNAVYDAVATKVTKAASSTDNAIARYDGTTGGAIQNSSPTIDDAGAVRIPNLASGGGIKSVVADTDGDLSVVDTVNIDESSNFIKALQAMGSTIKAETVNASYFNSGSGVTMTDARISFMAVYLSNGATITGVKFQQDSSGTYTADNENRIGLYTYNSSTGELTLVASSANNGDLWKGVQREIQTVPFTTPYVAAEGLYFVGLIYNTSAATRTPRLLANSNDADYLNTLGFTNNAGFGLAASSQTTLGSSYNSNSLAQIASRFWVGLY